MAWRAQARRPELMVPTEISMMYARTGVYSIKEWCLYHFSFLISHFSFLISHFSFFILHSSFFILHSSFFIPHSYILLIHVKHRSLHHGFHTSHYQFRLVVHIHRFSTSIQRGIVPLRYVILLPTDITRPLMAVVEEGDEGVDVCTAVTAARNTLVTIDSRNRLLLIM